MQTPDNSGWEIDNKVLTDAEYQNFKKAYPGIAWIEITWTDPVTKQKDNEHGKKGVTDSQ
jgi:hypothetical protein